jgi:hypothetical protein
VLAGLINRGDMVYGRLGPFQVMGRVGGLGLVG